MPNRDPDELLAAFAIITADAPRPSIPSARQSVIPRLAVATLLIVVLAAVAGAAFIYGPRLVPPATGDASSAGPPLGEGRSATWRLDPGDRVTRDSAEIAVLLTEIACASGRPPEGRVLEPTIAYGALTVEISFRVRPFTGNQDCPGNPEFPTIVRLLEPIGLRRLIDGADGSVEWQPQSGLIDLPERSLSDAGCYPTYLQGAFLAGDATDQWVAWVAAVDGRRVNVLWPGGYSARFVPEVELVGPNGQFVARAGDELALGGSFVPTGEFAACEVIVGPLLNIRGDPLPWPSATPEATPSPAPIATRTPLPTSPLEGSLLDCDGLEVPPFRDGGVDTMDTNLDTESQILELTIFGRGDESTTFAFRYTDLDCLEHPVLAPIIRHVLEEDTYVTTWTMDDQWPTGALTATLHLLASHEYCVTDPLATGFVLPPDVTYEDDRILITLSGVRDFLPYLCEQTETAALPMVIELEEPVGERPIFDGGQNPAQLVWAASLWPEFVGGVLTSVSDEDCRGIIVDADGGTWEIHWPHFVFLVQGRSLTLQDPTDVIAREGDQVWLSGTDVTATGHTRFCEAEHIFDAGGIFYVEPANP